MDTTQLLKGVLDVAVLAVITDEDGYGYDVVRRLRASGLADVGDASVYGTLKRLYSAGALTTYVVPSEDGPHRKYYGINAQGRTMLAEQREVWQQFSTTMGSLLEASVASTREPRKISALRERATTSASAAGRGGGAGGSGAPVASSDKVMWKIGDTL